MTQFVQIAVLFDMAKIYYFQHCFSRSFDSSQPYRIWSQRCLCHIFVSYCSRYAFDHQAQTWHFMHFILPFQCANVTVCKGGGWESERIEGEGRGLCRLFWNTLFWKRVESVLPSSLVRFCIIEVSRVVQGLATINWFTDTLSVWVLSSASHVPTLCCGQCVWG